MDEVIWVEILSRHGDVLARHRCFGAAVRVGRGYSNDVIVEDPLVAPQHLRITRDESGRLVAESVAAAEGLYVGAGTLALARIFLHGDQAIRIGQTHLRVRDAHYVEAPDRRVEPNARLWPVVLALGAAILGMTTLSLWLSETAEPKLYRYLLQLLLVSVLPIGWTAAWATMSRIFSGRARFERHLLIALSGVLAYVLYDEFVAIGSYAMSWSALTTYQYAGLWVILAGVCFGHLREIGSSRLELKAAAVIVVMCVAIAMQTLSRLEASADYGQQNVVRRLMPPVLRLAPLRSETGFFADVEQLKKQLDHSRAEAPPPAPSSGEESGD
jgi:hypothetical protein